MRHSSRNVSHSTHPIFPLRRWMLATMFIMTGVAAALAGAIEDCNQGADLDRRIRGCTAIIQGEQKVADQTVVCINRGVAWVGKGDRERALADFDQAIRSTPKSVMAHLNRGIARAEKGENDSAIADFDQVIRLDPKSASALAVRR